MHLHPEFGIGDFFSSAHANFEAAAREAGIPKWQGAILFTESGGVERFTELQVSGSETHSRGSWTFEPTDEQGSLVARNATGAELLLIAGRQIRVEGRLEVLAVCTAKSFPDGGRLEEVARNVRAAGAVPILPWGFGKWWSKRGEIVESALRRAHPGDFLLGDSGQRPRSLPQPKLFHLARERGIPILNGTDPLDYPAQARRVGTYGSFLDLGGESGGRPSEMLRDTLLALSATPPSVGRRVSLGGFVSAQIRIRIPIGGSGTRRHR